MIARVLNINVGPERVQQLVDSYEELLRPVFATAPGLHCHYVLANRATGDVQLIGMWESEEAVKAIAPRLERHVVRCDFGGPARRKA